MNITLIVRGNSKHMEVFMSEILISWDKSYVLHYPNAVCLSSHKQIKVITIEYTLSLLVRSDRTTSIGLAPNSACSFNDHFSPSLFKTFSF